MGTKHIQVAGSSESGVIPVRRRNPQGSEAETISASIPKELVNQINDIAMKTGKSKSLVIAELVKKGLEK